MATLPETAQYSATSMTHGGAKLKQASASLEGSVATGMMTSFGVYFAKKGWASDDTVTNRTGFDG